MLSGSAVESQVGWSVILNGENLEEKEVFLIPGYKYSSIWNHGS